MSERFEMAPHFLHLLAQVDLVMLKLEEARVTRYPEYVELIRISSSLQTIVNGLLADAVERGEGSK